MRCGGWDGAAEGRVLVLSCSYPGAPHVVWHGMVQVPTLCDAARLLPPEPQPPAARLRNHRQTAILTR